MSGLVDSETLGRRLIACSAFRWMPGMAYISLDAGHRYVGRFVSGDAPQGVDVLPLVYDPATKGCLLELAREALGDSALYVRLSDTTRQSDGVLAWEILGWFDARRSPNGRPGSWRGWGYANEEEALVVAVETASGIWRTE